MNIDELIKVIPSSSSNLKRLDYLHNNAKLPRIAVFGTYNHGKSTLLNALIGKNIFKAADKRETIEIQEYEYNGIVWVDTPGLGADIAKKDDQIAKESAFKIADFIFIVHNVQVGELDKEEDRLYRCLMRQDKNYKNKLFLVLTQIDQINQENLLKVKGKIQEQIPNLKIMPVSAIRFSKGKEEGKQKLVEVSGIPEVLDFVEERKINVNDLRKKEIKRLVTKALVELSTFKSDSKKRLDSYNYKKLKEIKQFENNFNQVRSAIKNKMEYN